MIASQEQMDVYETSLSPGWDIVLREVMTRLNESAQDVLKTVRPGITGAVAGGASQIPQRAQNGPQL